MLVHLTALFTMVPLGKSFVLFEDVGSGWLICVIGSLVVEGIGAALAAFCSFQSFSIAHWKTL